MLVNGVGVVLKGQRTASATGTKHNNEGVGTLLSESSERARPGDTGTVTRLALAGGVRMGEAPT